jgi:alpha-1,6-mannosyltransferase
VFRSERVGAALRSEPYLLIASVLTFAAALILIRLPWQIDLGIHAATLQRWLRDPTPEVHPLIGVATQSPYYSPYMGVWTLVGHLFDLPVLRILRLAGLVNVVIMIGGLWYAVRGLTTRPWAPVLAVITCGVLWGVQTLSWSGFFSVTTVTFSMPFPSFFATAVGLWLWGITLRCGRARRVGAGQAAAVAVLAAVIVLSHQFTAVGIAVLAGSAALAPLLRSGWPPGGRMRYLIMWLLSAVAAAVLCFLWPFYSINELLGSASGFNGRSRLIYRSPLLHFCLLLLALPAVVVRARRKGPADPVVLAAAVLIAIAVVGGLTDRFWLGRLIPAGAIALQIVAAVEMTAALAPRGARLRVGACWRWAAVVPTAIAVVLGLWVQLGVFTTLWPGSLPDRPLDARVNLHGRYDWATRHMSYGDTVLTSHRRALRLVPAYGPYTVTSPYPEPTVAKERARRLADTRMFVRRKTEDSSRAKILARYDVEWVVEPESTWRPPDTDWGRRTFTKVAERNGVVVYRVRR